MSESAHPRSTATLPAIPGRGAAVNGKFALRTIEGAELRRWCLSSDDGSYTWVAQLPVGTVRGDQYRLLTLLRGHVAADWVLPEADAGADFRYLGLATPRLLVEELLLAGVQSQPNAFNALGESIRRLHAVPVPDDLRPATAKGPRAFEWFRTLCWVARGEAALAEAMPMADAAEAAFAQVLLKDPLFRKVLDLAVAHADSCIEPVILHGSLGSTHVALAAGAQPTWALMGWHDVAVGPPALDIGWLLGELAEQAVLVQQRMPSTAIEYGRAAYSFVRAAQGCEGGPIDQAELTAMEGFAALRVLHHLRQHARVFGADKSRAEAVFAAVQPLVAEWVGRLAVAAGGEVGMRRGQEVRSHDLTRGGCGPWSEAGYR